jgi:hypothetical protein
VEIRMIGVTGDIDRVVDLLRRYLIVDRVSDPRTTRGAGDDVRVYLNARFERPEPVEVPRLCGSTDFCMSHVFVNDPGKVADWDWETCDRAVDDPIHVPDPDEYVDVLTLEIGPKRSLMRTMSGRVLAQWAVLPSDTRETHLEMARITASEHGCLIGGHRGEGDQVVLTGAVPDGWFGDIE